MSPTMKEIGSARLNVLWMTVIVDERGFAVDASLVLGAVAERDKVDFSGADLRGVDFRNVDLSKFVLRDAYLRYVDFRGCDLRHLDLSGVSLHGAKIGGAYLPENVLADDIRMSLRHGTRIRTRSVAESL